MKKSPSKKGWSTLEISLLAGVIALLCVAGGLVALLVGDFAFLKSRPQATEAAQPANPPGVLATTPPLTGGGDEIQSITLSPTVGAPGTTITVQGQGWPAQSRVVIYLAPVNPPRYAINSAMADAGGNFSVPIIVPSDPRWLDESPVPVVAELSDGSQSAQAMLNISSPTDGVAAVTPIPAASRPQPTPTLAPPTAGSAQLTVNAHALNVRQGPGTNYPILGVLLNGQKAEITGRNADATWWQIKYPGAADGFGWVSAAYATAENIGNVPVVNAPPPPAAPPPTPTPLPNVPITEWRGEYYSNPDLQGQPTLVRNDPVISYDWGLGSPDPQIPVDNFSARWTRTVNFSAGVYRFYSRTDDGVRLWVDGALIINQWVDQSPTTHAADIFLTDGPHYIRMEYYERAMGAVAMLSWQRAESYPDWQAEYYSNTDLQGQPILTRNEPVIDYTWTGISPAPGVVPADNFSVRWTRQASFEHGDYRFKVRSDDGVRVWVDNDLVIDHWRDGDSGWLEEYRTISGGVHTMRVEYYKRGSEAFITFNWERRDRPDQPPLAVISAPSEGVAGQPVNFDGGRSRRGDNDIARYRWDFGDGTTAEGKRVSHTYNHPGDYKATLTVVDRKGLRDSTNVTVRIKQDPSTTTPPTAHINGPSTAQQGDTVAFDGSSSQSVSPIVDYQWNFGDGATANGSNVTHVYNQPGDYDVSLIVVAQNGLRGSARQHIRIDSLQAAAKPVANINAPATTEVGKQENFDASASTADGQIVSYAWNFGDGDTANGVNVPHTYQKGAGIYNVTLTVIDDLGQSNTANHQITVNPSQITPVPPTDTPVAQITPPPPAATDTPVPQITPPPPAATDTPVPQITPPPPAATDTPVPQITPPPPAATDTPVPPQATPTPPPLPPQAVINGPNQGQVGDGLLFDGSFSQSSSPIVSWAWDFGDGATDNSGMGVGHSYNAPGSYNVTLTITDQNGLQSTETHPVQIDPVAVPQPLPQPVPQITPPPPPVQQPAPAPPPAQPPAQPATPPQPPTAVISGPGQGQAGTPLLFDGSQSQSSSPIVSWQWDYGDGMSDNSGMGVPHIYAAPGQYILTLTVTDQNGLSDTASQSIDIQPAPQAVPQITPPPPASTP